MFRLYKAPKQWESDAHITIAINTLAAHEIERAVSLLPEKHRYALRWAYVFAYIPINRVRRELGVTLEELAKLIDEARTMVIDRLKDKIKKVT
jgi:DNA-directed RNA polymerase specialized sigma24 family protein